MTIPPHGHVAMSAAEFLAALKGLGMQQAEAARLLGIEVRAVRQYAHGERPVSRPVSLLLRLMLEHPTACMWLRELTTPKG